MQAGMLQLEIVAFTDEVLGHALLHGVKGFPLPLIELLEVAWGQHCRIILSHFHLFTFTFWTQWTFSEQVA